MGIHTNRYVHNLHRDDVPNNIPRQLRLDAKKCANNWHWLHNLRHFGHANRVQFALFWHEDRIRTSLLDYLPRY